MYSALLNRWFLELNEGGYLNKTPFLTSAYMYMIGNDAIEILIDWELDNEAVWIPTWQSPRPSCPGTA